ncbi:MAG: peptidoglycan DD-metalloendopeptidase family protein [Chloroflexota bacterium]|nr:peptidoglycan DD-metalloendopeptidase family protein [Chloroflexota bacterium]
MPVSPGLNQSAGQNEELTLRRRIEEGISRALAGLIASTYRLSGDWSEWHAALSRVSAHAAVLLVAITGISLSTVEWSAQTASSSPSLSTPSSAIGEEGHSGGGKPLAVSSISGSTSDVVFRQAQPQTTIPKRPRLRVVTYTVQVGDTIQSIATQFGLDPTTIMWANPAIEDAPDLLQIGQQVVILPIDGVYHRVAEDDTLGSIAEMYEVEPEAITSCEYNDLGDPGRPIEQGEYLIVPGGEKPYEPKVVTAYTGSVPEGARGTGRFQWPVLGRITQDYWYGHRAIDIGAPTGSAVLATDGGFISFVGWTDVGYGYLIVVDHGNGFATYYAHLSNIYVVEGQAVERGKVIGAVGNTGNSTGPHLHFEVRRHGSQQNPRAYLP